MWNSEWTGLPAVALALLVALAATTPAEAGGSRVLAQWSNGKWYPAQITDYDGRRYHVLFDDGDTSYAKEHQVRPFTWDLGTRVQCKWQQGNRYYQGRIAGIRGDKVRIQYDDGGREVTNVRYCRSDSAGPPDRVPRHVRESSRGVPSDPKEFLRVIERNRRGQSNAYDVQPAPRRSRFDTPSHGGRSARDVSSDPEAFLSAIERNLGD